MLRFYFRRAGFKTVSSPVYRQRAILEAYQSALARRFALHCARPQSDRQRSPPLRAISRRLPRSLPIQAAECAAASLNTGNEHGQKRIATLERRHIVAMMDAKQRHPERAFS
jgi:hypothetical protein